MKKMIAKTMMITLLLISSVSMAATIDEIRKKLDTKAKAKTPIKEKYNIQSISKSRANDFIWSEGSGNRTVFVISVKFRIKEKGDNLVLPHLCVYLFDKEKFLIRKITDYFVKDAAGTREGSGSFKGNKTYVIQFPYTIEEKVRYAIAVIGDNSVCSVATLPKSLNLDEFEFKEKSLLK